MATFSLKTSGFVVYPISGVPLKFHSGTSGEWHDIFDKIINFCSFSDSVISQDTSSTKTTKEVVTPANTYKIKIEVFTSIGSEIEEQVDVFTPYLGTGIVPSVPTITN